MRHLLCIISVFFITSCDDSLFFNSAKKQFKELIVDFSSVDNYPSFKICDSLINKEKKENCFRVTIHKKIDEGLKKRILKVKESLDETIYVNLIINNLGEISFQNLEASTKVKRQLPKLDSLIKVSVDNLPSVFPANKRGIPVITKYKLPISIKIIEK